MAETLGVTVTEVATLPSEEVERWRSWLVYKKWESEGCR